MAQPHEIEQAKKAGRERGWRFYLACTIGVLTLIFIIQNGDKTQVKFLFADTEMPLFFALIIAVLLGAAIGWLTPKVRRGHRVEKRADIDD